ncbi:46073_t:CDS:2, partial [Gigaspora margarita]
STMDSDEFYLSDKEERNNNDNEAIPSTSISTSNLKSVKKKKARRPESFVWKFFKKYKCTILLLDNQEEEVEKAQCLFEGYDMDNKTNNRSYFKDINTVSLTLDIWSLQAHDSYLGITCHWLTDLFELHKIVLEIGELDDHCATNIVESVNSVLDKFNIN